MNIIQFQITAWDKVYNVENNDNLELSVLDYIIIKTESGLEIAKVIDIVEKTKDINIDEDVVIERKASDKDVENIPGREDKETALRYCYATIKNFNLAMKLVDINFSHDDRRITFAFVADGRVDFRDLVKELSSHFNKNIRLQQIGIRDEAKLVGDRGRCGRGLCCKDYLKKFTSVTGEMAEAQNLAGRGSDRISGCCGRLMCCLAYEFEGYKYSKDKLPAIGTKVNVDGDRGVVVGQNILKESVDVKFPGEKGEKDFVVTVDINRNKK